jgi:hypothetical protein
MKPLIGSVLSTILLFISIVHIYWGIGGKTGSPTAVPTKKNNVPVIKPGPLSCIVVALTLASFGVYILIKSGIIGIHLPVWISNCGLWMISGIFLLRAVGDFKYVGFFKEIKSTKFGQLDAIYYSPLCLLLSLLVMLLEFIN